MTSTARKPIGQTGLHTVLTTDTIDHLVDTVLSVQAILSTDTLPDDITDTAIRGFIRVDKGRMTPYRTRPRRLTGRDRDTHDALRARIDFHTGRNVNIGRSVMASMMLGADTLDMVDTLAITLLLVTTGTVRSVGTDRWRDVLGVTA